MHSQLQCAAQSGRLYGGKATDGARCRRPKVDRRNTDAIVVDEQTAQEAAGDRSALHPPLALKSLYLVYILSMLISEISS